MTPFISTLSNVENWLQVCRQDLTNSEHEDLKTFVIEVLPKEEASEVNEAYFKGLKKHFSCTKPRAFLVKAVFAASVVREFILREHLAYPDANADYQEEYMRLFSGLAANPAESVYLPRYFWAVRASIGFVPDYYNQCMLRDYYNKMLLKIGSLIEGSGAVYSTGGAPSPATKRRIFIHKIVLQNEQQLEVEEEYFYVTL